METKTLDLIMTTYNEDQDLLLRALKSLNDQIFRDFRVIFVIEPNDKNLSFLKKYTKDKDYFLIIENKIKLGFVRSLNIGLKYADAKYIGRFDSDDFNTPEKFSRQIGFLEKNPDIGVIGTAIKFDTPAYAIRKYKENHQDIKKDFLFSNAVAHPTIIMRKRIIDQYGGYDESFLFSEDLELWLRFLKNGVKFYNLQESLLVYSIARRKKSRRDRVFIFKARLKHCVGIFGINKGIASILVYGVISIIPSVLYEFLKSIFEKKIGNISRRRL